MTGDFQGAANDNAAEAAAGEIRRLTAAMTEIVGDHVAARRPADDTSLALALTRAGFTSAEVIEILPAAKAAAGITPPALEVA